MKGVDVLGYTIGSIKLRRLRSGLTILGVMIGVATIVALLSLGLGFQVSVSSEFQKSFATNSLVVTSFDFGLGQADTSVGLSINDIAALDKLQNVQLSTPTLQKTCDVVLSGRSFVLNIIGIDFQKYPEIYNSVFVADTGVIPSSPSNNSVIIGARISNPWKNGTIVGGIGDSIKISFIQRNNTTLTSKVFNGNVVAVLKEIGGFGLGGPSDFDVFIPISTAVSFLQTTSVTTIIVQLTGSDKSIIDSVSNSIEDYYGGHVQIFSLTAILDILSNVFSKIQILLLGIAFISLLVAGIGIMNTMVVSLMERTKEIGILKALGMKNRTVLLIFLNEAIMIGLIGTVLGITAGWGLANTVSGLGLINQTLPGNTILSNFGNITIKPLLTPIIFAGAIAFGVVVSMVFGIYPAWRASKLKPVDALRYE